MQVGVDRNALVTCLDIGCGQIELINCRDAARAVDDEIGAQIFRFAVRFYRDKKVRPVLLDGFE